MKEQSLIWTIEPAIAIKVRQIQHNPSSPAAAGLQAHRKLRVALPLPRRESCVTRRAMLAALREAELAAWQASGGDALHV